MKTYNGIYTEFIDSLRTDLAHARSADLVSDFNPEVCIASINDYWFEFNTLEGMQDAIERYQKDTTTNGFISTKATLEHEVDGWCEDGDIEVNSVSPYLSVVQYRPMTDKEFSKLLSQEITIKNLFKEFITTHLKKSHGPDKYHSLRPDCKVLSLFRDGVITYDQLGKATYSNC